MKLEFLAYQRVGLLKGKEIGSLLMHASIPSTHVSSLSLGFLYFSFSFLFLCLRCFIFFLSISFFFCLPLFLPYCSHLWPFILSVMTGFTVLPHNCFWLIIGILSRLPTGLSGTQLLPLHYVGLHHALFQDKNGFFFFFLSLSYLS